MCACVSVCVCNGTEVDSRDGCCRVSDTGKMYRGALLVLLLIASLAIANGKIFNFEKLENYTRLLGFGSPGESANELWHGIVQDCSRKVSFSCIQKNAYTYLDRTFIDRDNITVFDGLRLTRNNLDYDDCGKVDTRDNLVEDGSDEGRIKNPNDDASEKRTDEEYDEEEEHLSPLEEVTHALRKKTLKFLATRDYEVQLPRFLAGGASFKISPREIDENGALVRIDFGNRAVDTEQQHGRLFLKKISKHQRVSEREREERERVDSARCRYNVYPRGCLLVVVVVVVVGTIHLHLTH